MKKIAVLMIVAAAIAGLFAHTAMAKKYKTRKFAGQYDFAAGALFTGTLVFAKNRDVSRLVATSDIHSVVGVWKLKRHKQRITIRWPDAVFTGQVVTLDYITGTYSHVSGVSDAASLTRIPMESNVIHHVHIYRAAKAKAKGCVFFNYRTKQSDSYLYRIVVYSNVSGQVARIVKNNAGQKRERLRRYGFFWRNGMKPYDTVTAYLISRDYTPPDTTASVLPIDGTNVFAYDQRDLGFKWFDWSTTNAP